MPDPIDKYLRGINYGYWSFEADDEKIIRKLLDAMSDFSEFGPAAPKAAQLTPERNGLSAKLWRNGSILSVGFLDGEPSLRWQVAKTASEWMEHANIRFVFSDRADACIRISFSSPGSLISDFFHGSWAYQGTDALSVARDQPTVVWFLKSLADFKINKIR